MIIEFIGIEFNSNVPDSNGCLWFITEMEGWGSPPNRLAMVDPTSKDGSIQANNLLASRALGLTVIMKAPTEDKFWLGYNYLLDTVDLILLDPVDFVVHEGTTKRKVGVIKAGEVGTKFLGACALTANVALTAPDPKKYVV